MDVAFRGSAPDGPGFWYPPTVVLPRSTDDPARWRGYDRWVAGDKPLWVSRGRVNPSRNMPEVASRPPHSTGAPGRFVSGVSTPM